MGIWLPRQDSGTTNYYDFEGCNATAPTWNGAI